jgi:hypothetical protein
MTTVEKTIRPVVKPPELDQSKKSNENLTPKKGEKLKDATEKLKQKTDHLSEKRSVEQDRKDFLKKEYQYESSSNNPPDIGGEDEGIEDHYF